VSASGVVPVESAAVGGQNAETIRHLVELSARRGTLEQSFQHQIEGAIELETLRLDALVDLSATPTVVPRDATVADVQRAAARSGHMRILVSDSKTGIPGVVHVRDTLLDALDAPAAPFVRSALALTGETPVYEVLAQMRATSQQLVVVVDDGQFRGVVTLSDVLARLLSHAGGD
jgi:CBS domain containing-hemolysin-like protein